MLTRQQQKHFDVFGFLVIPQLFSPDEIAVIIHDFEAAMLEDRDGKPFDGQARQQVNDWYLGRPCAELLIDNVRINGQIEQLLGPGYSFKQGNDGNFYVGDTGWHPDMGWDAHIPEGRNDPNRFVGQWRNHYRPSIKVAFYLDPVGKESGCLRVIPGAHRNPYHDQLWSLHLGIPAAVSEDDRYKFESVRPKLLEMWEQATGDKEGGERLLSEPDANHFGIAPCDIPSFPIESSPGDAVFFSHQLWHASFGGRVGRRMFTLNFRGAPPDAGESR